MPVKAQHTRLLRLALCEDVSETLETRGAPVKSTCYPLPPVLGDGIGRNPPAFLDPVAVTPVNVAPGLRAELARWPLPGWQSKREMLLGASRTLTAR